MIAYRDVTHSCFLINFTENRQIEESIGFSLHKDLDINHVMSHRIILCNVHVCTGSS